MLRFAFIVLALIVGAVAVVVLLAGVGLLIGSLTVYHLATRKTGYQVIGPMT